MCVDAGRKYRNILAAMCLRGERNDCLLHIIRVGRVDLGQIGSAFCDALVCFSVLGICFRALGLIVRGSGIPEAVRVVERRERMPKLVTFGIGLMPAFDTAL